MTKKNMVAEFEKIVNEAESEEALSTQKVCFQTLVERVLRILNDGVEKLKIALVLPQLLNEKIQLRKHLTPTNYQKLLKYCEKYSLTRRVESEIFFETLSFHLDFRLLKAVEIVHECPEIRENLDNYLDEIPDMSDRLLKAMYNIQQIADTRLKTTAITEMARERLTHYIYHENEKTNTHINTINAQLREKEINLRWKITAKQAVIKKYQEDLAFKKWENSIKVKKEIARANLEMDEHCGKNEQVREQLLEEVKNSNIQYKKLLKKNTDFEKVVQAKKNIVKKELEDWIRKYDTDILEKVMENYKIDEEIDEVQAEFDQFMIDFQEQETLYAHLFRKKDREDKRIQEEKMLVFMMNRAARTIQRYWREYARTHKRRRRRGAKAKPTKGKAKGKKK